MTNLIERCGDGGGGIGAAYDTSSARLLVTADGPIDIPLEVYDGSLAVGSYDYPSASGFSLQGVEGPVSLQGKIVAPAGCEVRLYILGSNDPGMTDITDVTPLVVFEDGTTSHAYYSVANTTAYPAMLIKPEYLAFSRAIVRVEVIGASATTVSLWLNLKRFSG